MKRFLSLILALGMLFFFAQIVGGANIRVTIFNQLDFRLMTTVFSLQAGILSRTTSGPSVWLTIRAELERGYSEYISKPFTRADA